MTTDDPRVDLRAGRRAAALRRLRVAAAAENLPEPIMAEREASLCGAFLATDLANALFGAVDTR